MSIATLFLLSFTCWSIFIFNASIFSTSIDVPHLKNIFCRVLLPVLWVLANATWVSLFNIGSGLDSFHSAHSTRSTRPYQTGPIWTRPDQIGPDRTRTDQTGPDRTRPDHTGPDRTNQNWPTLHSWVYYNHFRIFNCVFWKMVYKFPFTFVSALQ